MLFPEELDRYASSILYLINSLEEFIITDVSRRIAKQITMYENASLTETAILQIRALEEAGVMMSEIKKQIASNTNLTLAEIEKMFYNANVTSLEREQIIGNLTGRELAMSAAKHQVIQEAIKSFSTDFLNMTGSVGFKGMPIEQIFHTILNKAFVEVASGASDYISAIKRAVKELADSGLQYVSYGSKNDRLDVAVRRAILTALQQVTNKISKMNAQEMGADGYQISAHAGARPTHALWQGKIFAIHTMTDDYPLFDEVVGDQMDEPNCRHTKWGVFLYITEPYYTEYQLSQLDTTFIFNGKEYTTYEATQYQRAIERNIRDIKRRITAFQAAGLDTSELKARLKQQRQLYTEFSKAANLLEQKERLWVV